jgi:hypothetical protein
MASCSHFNSSSTSVSATDCVNGTIMPRHVLPAKAANYTEIHRVFQKEGWKNPLTFEGTRHRMTMPYDTEIIIYNKTKVNISEAFQLHWFTKIPIVSLAPLRSCNI